MLPAWMSVAHSLSLVLSQLIGRFFLDGHCIKQLFVSYAQRPRRKCRTWCCSGVSIFSLQVSLVLTVRVAHGRQYPRFTQVPHFFRISSPIPRHRLHQTRNGLLLYLWFLLPLLFPDGQDHLLRLLHHLSRIREIDLCRPCPRTQKRQSYVARATQRYRRRHRSAHRSSRRSECRGLYHGERLRQGNELVLCRIVVLGTIPPPYPGWRVGLPVALWPHSRSHDPHFHLAHAIISRLFVADGWNRVRGNVLPLCFAVGHIALVEPDVRLGSRGDQFMDVRALAIRAIDEWYPVVCGFVRRLCPPHR